MPRILKRPRALADLAEIWGFIADHSEARADAFIDTLDRKFRILGQKPKIGRSRDDLAPNLRSFPVGRYVIFYLPITGGIEIVRVLHGARDVPAFFHSRRLTQTKR
ncbi:MAG: type II toxin-antitoxin system RelE/ParE family toxin [Candidatus Binataceae bacterium]